MRPLTPLRRQSCQADGTDALFIVTEWNEFRDPDFEHLKKLLKLGFDSC